MWAIAGQPDITRRLAITSHIKSYVSPKGALIFDHPHNGHYVGDRRQGAVDNSCHEAFSWSRASNPSKMRWRPTWPLAAASSRWRSSVGRNSMVVWKNVQDSQVDSKWQSSPIGRAQ